MSCRAILERDPADGYVIRCRNAATHSVRPYRGEEYEACERCAQQARRDGEERVTCPDGELMTAEEAWS